MTPPIPDPYGYGAAIIHVESPTTSPVQHSEFLSDALNWNSIYTNPNGGPIDYWDFDAVNYTSRFYRVIIQNTGIQGYY